MVNNYTGQPPDSDNASDEERFIGVEPQFELDRVQAIARGNPGVQLVTRKCIHNVANLGWDNSDVADLIFQLTPQHYKQSEWCLTAGGRYIRCDSYVITRSEFIQNAGKHMSIEYYVKYSVGINDTVMLIVSCHT